MKIRRCRVSNISYSTAAVRAVIIIAALAALLLIACATSADAAASSIGLPRTKDYEPIAELRDIYFDFGKADIRPADLTILEANAAWLRTHSSHLILIEGHADSRGATDRTNEFNIDLGERRALAARSYLVAHGIDPSRISILSYGQERPRCGEQSEECWSQNRRSRFLVKPR